MCLYPPPQVEYRLLQRQATICAGNVEAVGVVQAVQVALVAPVATVIVVIAASDRHRSRKCPVKLV